MDEILGGRTVVVASRDRLWSARASDHLEGLGASVRRCVDVDRVLAALADGDIALVVADGKSGPALLRTLARPFSVRLMVVDRSGEVPMFLASDAGELGPVVVHGGIGAPGVAQFLRAWFSPALDFGDEHIDAESISYLVSTFGPKIAVVFDVFKSDAPQRAERMAQAVAEHRWDDVRREAHSLKSTTATFGLLQMSADLAAVEGACRQGKGPDEAGRLQGFSARLDLAMEKLTGVLNI